MSRHSWNLEAKIAACDAPDGNDRTERTCPFCGLVRITVHYPFGLPGKQWRTKDGRVLDGNNVPFPCTGGPEKAAQQREAHA